ncbi:MAG: YHS domain-containing protein [Granulosicoccus sp.]|jgi:YHS domain-containing protein
MRLPRRLLVVALAAIGVLFTITAVAAEPVSKSRFSSVAIGGHDSVAYHQIERDPQQSAVEGAKTYTVEYKGAKWRFASKESSELFAANPDQYSPSYNGHCANALSLEEGLIRTDGTHWEIFEDKLYLFYAARGRVRWTDGNWKTYKIDADAAWSRLSVR